MERFNQEDDFFKKLKPERESFVEPDADIINTLEDQENISIKGDVSSEDYIDELNNQIQTRKIIGKEGKILNEQSWEEIIRDEELVEKINNLRIKYAKLKEEIKERQIILNELRYSKSGAEQSAKNLNWKELVSKEGNSVVKTMMRNVEDRIERLRKNIETQEIEMIQLHQQLGEIDNIMEMLTGLIRKEIPGEEKTVGNQTYDFNQN
ncbi:MAG: hypothetical protein QG580_335 [Patescibacteria group bacterium]|jgi:hypothetical protein|nr:hypothetical protein [Patescibacteria group bacterium]